MSRTEKWRFLLNEARRSSVRGSGCCSLMGPVVAAQAPGSGGLADHHNGCTRVARAGFCDALGIEVGHGVAHHLTHGRRKGARRSRSGRGSTGVQAGSWPRCVNSSGCRQLSGEGQKGNETAVDLFVCGGVLRRLRRGGRGHDAEGLDGCRVDDLRFRQGPPGGQVQGRVCRVCYLDDAGGHLCGDAGTERCAVGGREAPDGRRGCGVRREQDVLRHGASGDQARVVTMRGKSLLLWPSKMRARWGARRTPISCSYRKSTPSRAGSETFRTTKNGALALTGTRRTSRATRPRMRKSLLVTPGMVPSLGVQGAYVRERRMQSAEIRERPERSAPASMMEAQRSPSTNAHARAGVAGSRVRGRRAARAWWQAEGRGVPGAGVGARAASAVSVRASCWAGVGAGAARPRSRGGRLARQNRPEETAVKPRGAGKIVTEIVTMANSVHFNIVEAGARDQVLSAVARRLTRLLEVVDSRRRQSIKGDGQAGGELEVAETVCPARLVTGVAGDVLRQVGKKGSSDVMLRRRRSLRWPACAGGRFARERRARDGGDSLVEVIFWSAPRRLLDENGDYMVMWRASRVWKGGQPGKTVGPHSCAGSRPGGEGGPGSRGATGVGPSSPEVWGLVGGGAREGGGLRKGRVELRLLRRLRSG
ncbi:hypothetical protein ACSSS7_007847 [Eimeria intestinalis]